MISKLILSKLCRILCSIEFIEIILRKVRKGVWKTKQRLKKVGTEREGGGDR